MPLDINGDSGVDLKVIVTDRQNTFYEISFHICQPLLSLSASYEIEVSNGFGSDTESVKIEGTIIIPVAITYLSYLLPNHRLLSFPFVNTRFDKL